MNPAPHMETRGMENNKVDRQADRLGGRTDGPPGRQRKTHKLKDRWTVRLTCKRIINKQTD